jgi:RNA polymerase sigma-70 factor (ECF subfamily)
MRNADFWPYMDGLFGYAMVLTRNPTEASDLVQETYLRALQAGERLHSDRNLKCWLFTILRNIWLNDLRRRKNAPMTVELDVNDSAENLAIDTSQSPLALYVTKAERESVREAIQRLPVLFREIIILREYEELSYQEIADLLNCPEGTVMSRLARARSKLKDLLSSVGRSPNQRATKAQVGDLSTLAAPPCCQHWANSGQPSDVQPPSEL